MLDQYLRSSSETIFSTIMLFNLNKLKLNNKCYLVPKDANYYFFKCSFFTKFADDFKVNSVRSFFQFAMHQKTGCYNGRSMAIIWDRGWLIDHNPHTHFRAAAEFSGRSFVLSSKCEQSLKCRILFRHLAFYIAQTRQNALYC